MTNKYYSVLTHYGEQAMAKAIANKTPLQITHMAAGDGNGNPVTPQASNTQLVKEVYRAKIGAISIKPNNSKQVVFEMTIPSNVGGFTIREMGVFDNTGHLVAHANSPESYKPQLAEGSGKVQVLRLILTVSSSTAISLTLEDGILFATRSQLSPKTITASTINQVLDDGHSHAIDKASTTIAGITKLNSATDNNSENEAATPKAIKILKDLIDALTRNLGNYIPNSKKSNAINSNSADTVATSVAVKTAYDLAASKQNPATTLAGYKITDAITIAPQRYTGDLNALVGKNIIHTLDFMNNTIPNAPAGAYQWGILQNLTLGDFTRQIYYADNNQIWTRYHHTRNGWRAWYRLDTVLSDDLATDNSAISASAKAAKKLKDLIDALTRNLGNYIPNSKKSNAVNSASADTVATSVAVKTANDNANTKLPLTGGTVTGHIVINHTSAILRLQRNGENYGYVGFPSPNGEYLRFCSNKNASYLELQNDRIYASQNVYVGNNRVLNTTDLKNMITINPSDYVGDLNNLVGQNVVYSVNAESNKNANFPAGAYKWGFLHNYTLGQFTRQIYYTDTQEIWTRYHHTTHGWRAWYRLDTVLSDDLATDNSAISASAKAVKKLKDLIDALTRNLGNYIPNSKKSNAVNSASSDTVATSVAVKTAYDLATSANNNANTRLPLVGGTMTGNLSIKSSDYSQTNYFNLAGNMTRVETVPDINSNFMAVSYRNSTTALHSAYFPKSGLNQVVAYQSWVNSTVTNKLNKILTERSLGNVSGTVNLDINAVANYNITNLTAATTLQLNNLKAGDNGYIQILAGGKNIAAFKAAGFTVKNTLGQLNNVETLVYICSGNQLVISRFWEGAN